MTKLRHKVVPSVYLVLIQDHKVLMGMRCNTGYEDGKYGLIAGHAEAGESLKHAMIREAYEEAGISIKPEDLTIAHVMHRNGEADERIDVFMTARVWHNEITNTEPNKCLGWQWLDLKSLPDNVMKYKRVALDNILRENFYSELGW